MVLAQRGGEAELEAVHQLLAGRLVADARVPARAHVVEAGDEAADRDALAAHLVVHVHAAHHQVFLSPHDGHTVRFHSQPD